MLQNPTEHYLQLSCEAGCIYIVTPETEDAIRAKELNPQVDSLQKNGTKIEYIKEANAAPVRTAQRFGRERVSSCGPRKATRIHVHSSLDAIAFAPYQFT